MELSEAAREARREYRRAWEDKNRESRREYRRKWAKENPDKVKAATARYWTKKAAQQSKESDN